MKPTNKLSLAIKTLFCAAVFLLFSRFAYSLPDDSVSVLIVSGQSNKAHNWGISHKIIAERLKEAKIFSVDVALTPPAGESMKKFSPNWSNYQTVVLDYEGQDWPEATQAAFESYIKNGGGLVLIHAADNAFPYWPAFNKMSGVGGWGDAAFHNPPLNPGKPDRQQGRNETWGARIHWDKGAIVRDDSPGKAFHPPKHDFLMTTRAPMHPIMKGLPEFWMQGMDEIYSGLRGPGFDITVLATAIANPKVATKDIKHEPMLMTLNYGKGRVFHMTLGHLGPKEDGASLAMRNVSFITLLQRGTEWSATGDVTQLVPDDFPTAYDVSYREPVDGWENLLDPSLSKFEKFIGVPHSTVKDLPAGTPQSDDVRKGTPLGLNNDPKKIFTTYQKADSTILSISGEIYGALVTQKDYENYHLQAKFRWLDKKWEPRLQQLRDGGILFHSYGEHGSFWNVWKRSLEFQIEETDNGDFITIGNTIADVPSLPIQKGVRGVYDPSQPYTPFQGYLSASPEPDAPHGNWNTVDLYAHGDQAIYLVNGFVVMSLKNAKNDKGEPLTKGQIQIQSEGAEMEYKDIRIRPLSEFPSALKTKARL